MAELKVKDASAPMLFSIDGYRLVVMPVFVGAGKKEAEASAEVAQAEASTDTAEAVAEGEAHTRVETDDSPRRKHKAREPVAV